MEDRIIIPYPREYINYNEDVWSSYHNWFSILNENFYFSNNQCCFVKQDIIYIYNKKNDIIVDVGCYNDSTEKKKPKYARFPKDYRFLHYTVNVIGKDGNWSNPIEKVLVPTSFQLKAVVEDLLKKYEDWEG